MRTIQVVTDSTCDISPDYLKGEHLEVLPLTITFDDKNYLDGVDIGVFQVYEVMRQGFVPKTSQIPYDRTNRLFRSLLESGKDVIYISFSSALSGCWALGNMIAEELQGEFPDGKLAVLDSKGGAGATGLIVLQALKLARSGLPFETVVSDIRFMADHVEHVFSVDSLEWLAKGGRIPKVVGFLGDKLGFHPILDVEAGRMVVRKMIRGRKHALQTVADEIIDRAKRFPSQLIAICHADDLPAAKELEQLIKNGLPDCLTMLCHIGGVLGVHIGLKGISAFCFNQRPERYCPVS